MVRQDAGDEPFQDAACRVHRLQFGATTGSNKDLNVIVREREWNARARKSCSWPLFETNYKRHLSRGWRESRQRVNLFGQMLGDKLSINCTWRWPASSTRAGGEKRDTSTRVRRYQLELVVCLWKLVQCIPPPREPSRERINLLRKLTCDEIVCVGLARKKRNGPLALARSCCLTRAMTANAFLLLSARPERFTRTARVMGRQSFSCRSAQNCARNLRGHSERGRKVPTNLRPPRAASCAAWSISNFVRSGAKPNAASARVTPRHEILVARTRAALFHGHGRLQVAACSSARSLATCW